MLKRDSKGRVFLGRWEYFIQALIVLSLVTLAIQTLPQLPEQWHIYFRGFEIFTVAVFTVECLIRAISSRPRSAYLFSFYGIIDLIAIVPFYISLGLDLRAVRAFRLLRLFRIFKLARYSRAIQRIHHAFLIAREELILFGVTALIFLYLASAGIYYFERNAQPEQFGSIFHSMWWSIVTLTTVGYGDVYPITLGGRIFTFFILVLGLGIVAVPTGMFASALSKARAIEDKEYRSQLRDRLASMTPDDMLSVRELREIQHRLDRGDH